MPSEIMAEFIEDAREHLQAAGQHLLALERDHSNLDELNGLLRRIHTIKGNAGFLNLNAMYALLHLTENILQTAREQSCQNCSEDMVDVQLKILDITEAMLDSLEAGGTDSLEGVDGLIYDLNQLESNLIEARKDMPESPGPDSPPQEPETAFAPRDRQDRYPAVGGEAPSRPSSSALNELVLVTPQDLIEQGRGLAAKINRLISEGFSRLVFDLREIHSLYREELGVLAEAMQAPPDQSRTGMLLDPENQSGFRKVLSVMGLDQRHRVFTQESEIENT